MKYHPSHCFDGQRRCARCGEDVLSLDAKLPCFAAESRPENRPESRPDIATMSEDEWQDVLTAFGLMHPVPDTGDAPLD